ncbi:hypothetical protein FACS1894188_10610 [Clostridia bacterium]|nr:hypothetical protein FACS1894188_10610 [Clostridia bacterium]
MKFDFDINRRNDYTKLSQAFEVINTSLTENPLNMLTYIEDFFRATLKQEDSEKLLADDDVLTLVEAYAEFLKEVMPEFNKISAGVAAKAKEIESLSS